MNDDLRRTLDDLAIARAGLIELVAPLSGSDMSRARPGGWSAGRVLRHVIESDAVYTKVLAHQCSRAAPQIEVAEPPDGAHAATLLDAGHAAVMAMLDGIDDATLYRMVALGANDYSALSLLENHADHDHEHLAQISRLIGRPAES